jgi:hypothetical protein
LKQYEEKHGPVNIELYDISGFVYETSGKKSQFVYKPFGTFHEMTPNSILSKGLTAVMDNAVDKSKFFWKKYEGKHGAVDHKVFDVIDFIHNGDSIKSQFTYKPFSTIHEQTPSNALKQGLSVSPRNAVNKTEFFWKKYEERHGAVDHDVYDVSEFVYKSNTEKLKFTYKPYGTVHEVSPNNILSNGLIAHFRNSVDKTSFFWKQYEEKHGPIDHETYDVSGSFYEFSKSKFKFLCNPLGTFHEKFAKDILNDGLSASLTNSVDPKKYLSKRWASGTELVLYVQKAFGYIQKNTKGNRSSETESNRLYKEYYKKNPVDNIPFSLDQLESVYGVGGYMDQHGLKENVIETSGE